MVQGGHVHADRRRQPERVRGSRVTASLMPLLGIAPRHRPRLHTGRRPRRASPVADSQRRLWRRRFGADERVLGRTLQIDGESRTIVGVMPRARHAAGPLAGDDDLLAAGADDGRADRVNEVSTTIGFSAGSPTATTLEQASAELARARERGWQPSVQSHRQQGCDAWCRCAEQTVRSVQAGACADRRQRRPAAAGGQRQRLDAAAGARLEPTTRAGGTNARSAPRGDGYCRLRSPSRWCSRVLAVLAGLFLGAWTLRAVLPLFTEVTPASRSRSKSTARVAAVYRRGLLSRSRSLFGFVVLPPVARRRLVERLKASGRTDRRSAGRARGALVIAQVALAVVPALRAGADAEQRRQAVARPPASTPITCSRSRWRWRVRITASRAVAGGVRIDLRRATRTRLPGVRTAALTHGHSVQRRKQQRECVRHRRTTAAAGRDC